MTTFLMIYLVVQLVVTMILLITTEKIISILDYIPIKGFSVLHLIFLVLFPVSFVLWSVLILVFMFIGMILEWILNEIRDLMWKLSKIKIWKPGR